MAYSRAIVYNILYRPMLRCIFAVNGAENIIPEPANATFELGIYQHFMIMRSKPFLQRQAKSAVRMTARKAYTSSLTENSKPA